MASAWGSSWGTAWADSWGAVSGTPAPQTQAGGTSKKKRRPKTYAEIAHARVADLALDIPQVEPIDEQDDDEILLIALTRILH